MKNRGSTPILRRVHPRNIHTKFEANPCNSLREGVEKQKKVHVDDDNNDDNDDRHSLIARVTLTR